MKINGIELEDLDIMDLETAEKFEKQLENINALEKQTKENISMSEVIKIQCNAIFDVFNNLYGEGTDKKIFGNKVNLMTCLKAFEELVNQINTQKDEIERLTNKYSPNRAQRRAKK